MKHMDRAGHIYPCSQAILDLGYIAVFLYLFLYVSQKYLQHLHPEVYSQR